MVILFLNLGGSELLLILFVILMFFGSKNIPSLARSLGKGLREFREASDNIKREIEKSAEPVKEEMKNAGNAIKDQMKDAGENTGS